MKTTLTDEDVQELAKLGDLIKKSLSCDINCTGVPCVTDRLEAVADMIKYLEIHCYAVCDSRVAQDGGALKCGPVFDPPGWVPLAERLDMAGQN